MSVLEKQLDGVIESTMNLHVLPLADPPLGSYSDLVAAWTWMGRCTQGAVDEMHHCIVEAIDVRTKL